MADLQAIEEEGHAGQTVDVVVPVLNEETCLRKSIESLAAFLRKQHFAATIIIADNGSEDRTPEIGRELAASHAEVRYRRLEARGRGLALKAAWEESSADIVAYMDVDLSTNLGYFPLLVEGIRAGYDVAIGSRLMQASRTRRSFRREVLSRAYNLLVRSLFCQRFSDAQCGFKAIRRDVFLKLLPHIKDDHWFFDTEMLLLAERSGYRIFEVPVEWIEDLDTRVRIVPTAWEDIKGLLRVRFAGPRQVTGKDRRER